MKLFKNMKKRLLLCTAAGASVTAATSVVFADGDNITDTTTEKIIAKVVGIICSIARYIGIVLLAWGVVMLVLALKNEDADSKSRAVMLIVVSVVLIGLKTLLWGVLSAAGAGNEFKTALEGF